MEKPIEPIEPNVADKIKYPRPADKYAVNENFIRDYKKYQKDRDKYEHDMNLYVQTKFITDIQRSTLKLCLKKYWITKK